MKVWSAGMLHQSVDQDIRSRTLRNVQRRFIGYRPAQRVSQLASQFADQVKKSWDIGTVKPRSVAKRLCAT